MSEPELKRWLWLSGQFALLARFNDPKTHQKALEQARRLHAKRFGA